MPVRSVGFYRRNSPRRIFTGEIAPTVNFPGKDFCRVSATVTVTTLVSARAAVRLKFLIAINSAIKKINPS